MRAIIVAIIDNDVVNEAHEAQTITAKIHRDGRAIVNLGRDAILYRRVERIEIRRGDA